MRQIVNIAWDPYSFPCFFRKESFPIFLFFFLSSNSSVSSTHRANIFLLLPLQRYVELLVSPPSHVASVWSSANDSMH